MTGSATRTTSSDASARRLTRTAGRSVKTAGPYQQSKIEQAAGLQVRGGAAEGRRQVGVAGLVADDMEERRDRVEAPAQPQAAEVAAQELLRPSRLWAAVAMSTISWGAVGRP